MLGLVFSANINAKDFQESKNHPYDLTVLTNGIANSYGISTRNVKVLKVVDVDGDDWLYSEFTKDGNSITIGVDIEMSIGGGGPVVGPGGGVSCNGVKCSQCKVKGWPNVLNLYCDCTKNATSEEGYCNMSTSVKVTF